MDKLTFMHLRCKACNKELNSSSPSEELCEDCWNASLEDFDIEDELYEYSL